MSWRDILKDSPKLRQENITTTIVDGSGKPEKKDERCKKKLQDVIDGIFRLLQGRQYFMTYAGDNWSGGSVLMNPPQIGDEITEEAACSLLEDMRMAKNNKGFIWKGYSGIVSLCYMTGTEGADGRGWSENATMDRYRYDLAGLIKKILEGDSVTGSVISEFASETNWFFSMRSHPYATSLRPNETGEEFFGRVDNDKLSFCIRMSNMTKMAYAGEARKPENKYIESIAEEWKEIHNGIMGLI